MERTEAILADLIRIPSVNPRRSTLDGGETMVAQYLIDWANERGWHGRMDEVLPGRHNGVVTLPGQLPGTILLQTHSDTVEVDGMTVDPFQLHRRNGQLTGRGACDAKGQLAMFMAAMERLQEHHEHHHTIVLAACVDEEERFRGVLDLCERLDPKTVVGAVVGEPTELALVTAHKGVVRGRIVAFGPGGHSSMPDGVRNPIEVASEIVNYVTTELAPRTRAIRDPMVGAASLAVTMIEGGDAINIIPREVSLHYDRRTLPREDPVAVWTELKVEIENRFPDVRVAEPSLADPGLAHTHAPLIDAFGEILRSHGLRGEPVGVPYGSDASKIARLGIPAVVFGAGSIAQAHTHDEFVPVAQLRRGVDVIHQLLTSDLSRGAA